MSTPPDGNVVVVAEISITPIGSNSPSVGNQVAEAIKAIGKVDGIRKYEVNAMGTVLETDKLEKIFEAAKAAEEAIFKLGEKRVQIILKVDDRRDKIGTMESKVESVKKHGGV